MSVSCLAAIRLFPSRHHTPADSILIQEHLLLNGINIVIVAMFFFFFFFLPFFFPFLPPALRHCHYHHRPCHRLQARVVGRRCGLKKSVKCLHCSCLYLLIFYAPMISIASIDQTDKASNRSFNLASNKVQGELFPSYRLTLVGMAIPAEYFSDFGSIPTCSRAYFQSA